MYTSTKAYKFDDHLAWQQITLYSVSQKKSPPCGFLKFFP